jgi:serine protease Do
VAGRDLRNLRDPDEDYRLGLAPKAGAPEVRELGISTKPFHEVLGPARRATVEMLLDGRLVALGVVVAPDGVILTKRAEIMTRYGGPAGKLSCRLADGQTLPARVVADEHDHDVALVRVDRKGLPTAPWTEAKDVERRSLVAAVTLGQEPLAVGAWGGTSHSFRVKPARGQAGFDGRATKGGVRVTEFVLMPNPEMVAKSPEMKEQELPLEGTSYAWPAIRGGELITHVDGKPVTDEVSFNEATRGEALLVGELIRITILDNGKPRDVVFPLMPSLAGGSVANLPTWMKHRMQGFPAVVAHDAVVAVDRCGGPVVDLNGHVVGINIANARGTRMLAIPHTVVRRLLDQTLAAPK